MQPVVHGTRPARCEEDVSWKVHCVTNLGEKDVELGLCEPPSYARSAAVPERQRHERVDLPSGRQRALVSLEPTFRQEEPGRREVLLDVTDHQMREDDVRLRRRDMR
jgi:hypothetical protein